MTENNKNISELKAVYVSKSPIDYKYCVRLTYNDGMITRYPCHDFAYDRIGTRPFILIYDFIACPAYKEYDIVKEYPPAVNVPCYRISLIDVAEVQVIPYNALETECIEESD